VSGPFLLRGVLATMPRGSTPERRWRLLIAVSTIRADAEGWRQASMKLLGEIACLSQPHLREARDELDAARVLEYRHKGKGNGARHYEWRILVEELNPSGSTNDELNPSGSSGPGVVEPKSPEVEPPGSLTSDDPPLSFRASVVVGDADRSAAAAALAASHDWPFEHCLKIFDHLTEGRSPSKPYEYVTKTVAKAPAKWAPGRRPPGGRSKSPLKPTRPTWCGECHEQTRMRETDDDERRPYPCPKCHPSTR